MNVQAPNAAAAVAARRSARSKQTLAELQDKQAAAAYEYGVDAEESSLAIALSLSLVHPSSQHEPESAHERKDTTFTAAKAHAHENPEEAAERKRTKSEFDRDARAKETDPEAAERKRKNREAMRAARDKQREKERAALEDIMMQSSVEFPQLIPLTERIDRTAAFAKDLRLFKESDCAVCGLWNDVDSVSVISVSDLSNTFIPKKGKSLLAVMQAHLVLAAYRMTEIERARRPECLAGLCLHSKGFDYNLHPPNINICNTCKRSLFKDQLPKWALANDNWRGVELLPTHVRRPWVLEERAVCPITLLVMIVKLEMEYTRRTGKVIPDSHLRALIGGCIGFPAPTMEFHSALPVLLDHPVFKDNLRVVYCSPGKEPTADDLKRAVKLDGAVVQFWIEWFIENHVGFHELKVDFDKKYVTICRVLLY